MDPYVQLLERIAHAAKLSKEDVERKVEGKRAKLSGLVSREGAAQIVAAELGVNFDKEQFTIAELPGVKRANFVGQVIALAPVRSYSKNGREGKVVNLTLGDQTGTIRCVLWDVNHIALVEQETIHVGDTLAISNGMMRNGEVHLSSFADIKQSSVKLSGVQVQAVAAPKRIKDLQPGMKAQLRAFIVQAFDPRYFEVCPDCKKKLGEGGCATHGAVTPQKRALLSVVLDDGSETCRALFFSDQIGQLGVSDEELYSLEGFLVKKMSLLGEEFLCTGTFRQNTLYNSTEFVVDRAEGVVAQTLLASLQR
jgi:hypothetical protein